MTAASDYSLNLKTMRGIRRDESTVILDIEIGRKNVRVTMNNYMQSCCFPAQTPHRFNTINESLTMRLFLTIVLLSLGFSSSADDLIFLNDPADTTKSYPFSKATQVGSLLFLSGELGIDPKTGELVEGGVVPETKQLMRNISTTLEKYNSSLDKVAKCTVFLADIKDWPKFNEVYRSFFKGNYPARSAMAVSGLGLGAQLEVECIAVVNE